MIIENLYGKEISNEYKSGKESYWKDRIAEIWEKNKVKGIAPINSIERVCVGDAGRPFSEIYLENGLKFYDEYNGPRWVLKENEKTLSMYSGELELNEKLDNLKVGLREVAQKLEKPLREWNTEFLKICSKAPLAAIQFEDSLNAVEIFMNLSSDKSYRKCLQLSKKFKHGRKYKKQIKRIEKIRRKSEVKLNEEIYKTYMGNIK